MYQTFILVYGAPVHEFPVYEVPVYEVPVYEANLPCIRDNCFVRCTGFGVRTDETSVESWMYGIFRD